MVSPEDSCETRTGPFSAAGAIKQRQDQTSLCSPHKRKRCFRLFLVGLEPSQRKKPAGGIKKEGKKKERRKEGRKEAVLEDPLCSGSDYLSVHQSIVDVNTPSDRLIIEQLEHEITQKEGGGGEG